MLIYSITRVDEGQQNEMRDHGKEDPDAWEKWLHDTRIQLTRSNLDWVLHVGKSKDDYPAPASIQPLKSNMVRRTNSKRIYADNEKRMAFQIGTYSSSEVRLRKRDW